MSTDRPTRKSMSIPNMWEIVKAQEVAEDVHKEG
jgi:hypothetical protein